MSEAKFTKGPWISGMHDISDAEGYNVECEVDCGWSYIGTSKKVRCNGCYHVTLR